MIIWCFIVVGVFSGEHARFKSAEEVEKILLSEEKAKNEELDLVRFRNRRDGFFGDVLSKEFLHGVAKAALAVSGERNAATHRANLLSTFTEADMRDICSRNLSRYFAYDTVLRFLPLSSFRGIATKECLFDFPVAAGKKLLDAFPKEAIEYIPPGVFVEMDAAELESLGWRMQCVSDSTWRELVSRTECAGLSATCLVGMSKSKLAAITPTCFSNLTGLSTAKIKPGAVSLLAENIFSENKKRLSREFFRGMTRKQVSSYGAKTGNSDLGGFLDVQELSISTLPEVTPEQFSIFLRESPSVVFLQKERIKRLGADILARCSLADVKKIDTSTVSYFGTRLNRLPHACCSFFTVGSGVQSLSGFSPSGRCVGEFPADFLCQYLKSKGKLAGEDTLKYIDSDKVAQLREGSRTGLRVFDCFGLPDKAMRGLGDNVRKELHPCVLFKTKKEFPAHQWIKSGMGGSCLGALSFGEGLNTSDYERVPRDSIGFLPFSELRRLGLLQEKAGRWCAEDIRRMVANSEGFCSGIDLAMFRSLKRETYSAFTPACVQQFGFLDRLELAETKHMQEGAFGLLNSGQKIDLAVLGDKQLASLGKEGSACQGIDRTALSSLGKRLNLLSGACIQSIPGKSWEGMSVEQAKGLGGSVPENIQRDSLENMQREAVESIPKNSLYAAARRSSVKEPAQHPCHYLLKNTNLFGFFARRRIKNACFEYHR
ncbi:MAG: uncharacterized protein A8A55_2374 [Amphiamblys sp. WSBS2006]|nr:MAG: uncharacterized protein A8A55_2374 [Amphiamblys sp. WSBS2006]